MNGIDLITKRRSVRKYKDEVVSEEVLNEIIDLAKYAPSWANTQIARYNFVTNKEVINDIAENAVDGFVYNKNTLAGASNILVLSYVKGKSGILDGKGNSENENPMKWEQFDAGIACQTFCLAALEKGVSTCIFGVIEEEKIAKILNLSEDESVACIIVYGYADEEPKVMRRKENDELIRFIN